MRITKNQFIIKLLFFLGPNLYAELNVEKYELGKTEKLLFILLEGFLDNRFWATALAVYTAEQAPSQPSRPIARDMNRKSSIK